MQEKNVPRPLKNCKFVLKVFSFRSWASRTISQTMLRLSAAFLYLRVTLDTMPSSCVCVVAVRQRTGSKINMAAFSHIHVGQAYLFCK
jgi:hypothetical protein